MVVTFKTLHAHQQEALREWRKNVLDEDASPAPSGSRPQIALGLWVYGARRAGTSTIAHIAAGNVTQLDLVGTYEYTTALRLCGAIRQGWSADGVSRALPNDYDLYVEAQRAQDDVMKLWAADLLVVDDLHEEQIDMAFWRKHVQGEVEHRAIQSRVPTIIATDMAPNHPYLTGLQGFIEDLFVTCYAER